MQKQGKREGEVTKREILDSRIKRSPENLEKSNFGIVPRKARLKTLRSK